MALLLAGGANDLAALVVGADVKDRVPENDLGLIDQLDDDLVDLAVERRVKPEPLDDVPGNLVGRRAGDGRSRPFLLGHEATDGTCVNGVHVHVCFSSLVVVNLALARRRWQRRPGTHSLSEYFAMLRSIAYLTLLVNDYMVIVKYSTNFSFSQTFSDCTPEAI